MRRGCFRLGLRELRVFREIGIVAVCLFLVVVDGLLAEGRVEWDPVTASLEAHLTNAPLADVLADIGNLTGLEVMIEPGMRQRVSTRFEGLPLNQGLRRILGDLHFALLSGDNGSKRLVIYERSMKAATEALIPPGPPEPEGRRIENELIVSLDPNSSESIEEIAERLGAEIVGKIETSNAYRLRWKDKASADAARRSLDALDQVDVADNYAYEIPSRLAALNFGQRTAPKVSPNSDPHQERVVVGLIDTLVQRDGLSSSDFLLPGISVAGEGVVTTSEPTHGTTMAETMLRGLDLVDDGGQGSNVRILPVDVYGNQETTSTFQVAAGVIAAIESGASIINLSLGGQEATPFLQDVIRHSHQQGIVFVGAAGNEPGTHDIFPAAYPEVLAVTSANRRGDVAGYANHGSFVDVMVPGHSYVNFKGETWLINGTSASAAYVSGITAGVAAASGLPMPEVEAQVRATLPRPPGN